MHVAIRQGAQPVGHPGLGGFGDQQLEKGRILSGSFEHAPAHRAPIGLQDPGRLALARFQGIDVVGHRHVAKAARVGAFDLDDVPFAAGVLGGLVHEVVVRVAAGAIVRAQVGPAGQFHHVSLGFFQHVKVHLGPVHRPATARVGIGLCGLEHPGDDLGQLLDLGLPKAPLGDPGRPQPDAAGVAGAPVARDGVAIQDNACHIQDAGGCVAHERRAPLAVGAHAMAGADALAVCQEHVGVGASIGHAQAVSLQLGRQVGRVLDHL